MSQNRIEQLIEEMYEYIEGCKPKGFSATQVVVILFFCYNSERDDDR